MHTQKITIVLPPGERAGSVEVCVLGGPFITISNNDSVINRIYDAARFQRLHKVFIRTRKKICSQHEEMMWTCSEAVIWRHACVSWCTERQSWQNSLSMMSNIKHTALCSAFKCLHVMTCKHPVKPVSPEFNVHDSFRSDLHRRQLLLIRCKEKSRALTLTGK